MVHGERVSLKAATQKMKGLVAIEEFLLEPPVSPVNSCLCMYSSLLRKLYKHLLPRVHALPIPENNKRCQVLTNTVLCLSFLFMLQPENKHNVDSNSTQVQSVSFVLKLMY